MQRHRTRFMVLALSALIGLVASEAKAGYIIQISIEDVTTLTTTNFSVLKGGADDTTNILQVNAANTITVGGAFNTSGTGLNLTGLNSVTNNPGTSDATISIGGTASVVAGVATSDDKFTIVITTSQTGFTSPTGAHGLLSDSDSSTISYTTGAAGDKQTIQSWYNAANANPVFPPTGPVGGISTPGVSYALPATTSTTSLSSLTESTAVSVAPTPYSLIDRVTINITGNSSNPNGKDVFTGTTTLTATAVPEPSSIIMMLTGMPLPLALVGLIVRRRRAIAAG